MLKISTYLCAGASLLSLAAPAFAQTGQVIDETPPPGTELPTSEPEGADRADNTGNLAPSNEIVVSARRRQESVQDVPQTVNVVTSAQVEKLNLRNFTEISSIVPGLQLQTGSAFSNQATVRGIAFAPEASGNNPSVEFYFNDAPISSAFLFQSTFDFGQFELQRGPQGTLRGRASPSGSIAVTSRRPDLDEVGAVFNGTITDLHARKVDGAFNIPIISDVLAVRVAGVIDNNRGDRVRSVLEGTNQFTEGPFSRTKALRGSIRFEPTDWAQFNVVYQDLYNARHTFAAVVSEREINPAVTVGTTPLFTALGRRTFDEQGNYSDQDQKVLVGNADFQFAGQRLSFVGSWNQQDNGIIGLQDPGNFFTPPRIAIVSRAAGDPAGFDQACTDAVTNQGVNLTTGAFNSCTHSYAERYSYEARLASEERIAGIFDYVIGAFYDHNKNVNNLTQETPVVANAAAVPVNLLTVSRTAILTRGKATERSAFGNLTAHLLDDRLELSGGLRYIDFKSSGGLFQGSATGTVQCPGLAMQCSVLSPFRRDKDNATVYTGSVKFKLTDDIMLYGLTGSSYRPGPRVIGNFSIGPGGAGQTLLEQQFSILPPEKSRSYEIGAKISFLDDRGKFNIAAYHQKFRNYPFRADPGIFFVNFATATVGGVTTIVPNVNQFNFVSPVPVTVKGVEGELSFQINDRWSIGLNAAYADGKIKNGTIACVDLDRNGIPDVLNAAPSLAALQAAVGAGQTVSACSGINRRSAQTPKFSGNLQSEVGFDIGESVDGFARGLFSFFGKTSGNPDNPLDDVDEYGLLNLYAGIRDADGAWELTVFGKNILREREILSVGGSPLVTNVRTGAGSVPFTSEYRNISVTAPREFGLTAKIAFGSR